MADHYLVEVTLNIPDDDENTVLLGPFRQREAAEHRKAVVERIIARRNHAEDEEALGEHRWFVMVRPLWKPSLAATVVDRLADQAR